MISNDREPRFRLSFFCGGRHYKAHNAGHAVATDRGFHPFNPFPLIQVESFHLFIVFSLFGWNYSTFFNNVPLFRWSLF